MSTRSRAAAAVKEEPAENTHLHEKALEKALEENLKNVIEGSEEDPSDLLESKDDEENEEANDDDPEDEEEEEELEELPPKKEPKSHKAIRHSAAAPQPASYIMKLFDRSVNLAQFDEETPLYPLCRAWMKNQPRAIANRADKFVSDPLDVEDAQEVLEGDVVEMPKVRIRKGKTPARSEVRINKKDFDKQINAEMWTKKKLLDDHKPHWRAEKARHVKNSRMFEEKHFAANLELLESLIKESEE